MKMLIWTPWSPTSTRQWLTQQLNFLASNAGRGSPGLLLRSLIYVIKDETWRQKRGEPEGAKNYKEIKRKIRTELKMAKETWIQDQCQEVEACLRKNNSKKAYQLVKDLTTMKQGKSTTIQDKSGKCLTEENEILNRWTEYLVITLPKKDNLQLCQNCSWCCAVWRP